jgi:hypothetical protein
MIELLKKSERTLRTRDAFETWKALGATIQSQGRFMKWKNISRGRISVKFDIYKVRIVNEKFNLDSTSYVFSDTLDRIAFNGSVSYDEVYDWLEKHGYKKEKDFYIEEQGMSEEAWEAWCAE